MLPVKSPAPVIVTQSSLSSNQIAWLVCIQQTCELCVNMNVSLCSESSQCIYTFLQPSVSWGLHPADGKPDTVLTVLTSCLIFHF